MLNRTDHRLVAYALHDGFRSALDDLVKALPWVATGYIWSRLLDGFMREFEMKLRNDNYEFDRYEFQDIVKNRTPIKELNEKPR